MKKLFTAFALAGLVGVTACAAESDEVIVDDALEAPATDPVTVPPAPMPAPMTTDSAVDSLTADTSATTTP